MRSPVTKEQQSGRCSCAHDLTAVADLLRQALELIEGPASYEDGVRAYLTNLQAQQQRTERPHGGER